MGPSLTEILDAAAVGHFPPPDGGTTVVPRERGRDAGAIALTAHSVVSTDEDPHRDRSTLAALTCDGLAATEVDQDARHKELGRSLALAARHPVPDGAPGRSVPDGAPGRDRPAAGNARGIRAVQAAGHRPIGVEAPLLAPEAARAAR